MRRSTSAGTRAATDLSGAVRSKRGQRGSRESIRDERPVEWIVVAGDGECHEGPVSLHLAAGAVIAESVRKCRCRSFIRHFDLPDECGVLTGLDSLVDEQLLPT